MPSTEDVVYQVVTPGDPEENGRCCLNGVDNDALFAAGERSALFEARGVSTGGSMIEFGSATVGPLFTGGPELDVRDTAKKYLNPVRRTLALEPRRPVTAV